MTTEVSEGRLPDYWVRVVGAAGVSCEKIYHVVAVVPRGQVATYGQIADIVACSPREVGYANGRIAPRIDGAMAADRQPAWQDQRAK